MWQLLALLIIPLIEIALFVVIGGAIGLWATLAWVVVSAIIGVFVLRHEARHGALSFSRDVRALGDPTSPIASRALTIVGAALMILPGFLTDAIGLLLMLRTVQRPIIGFFIRRMQAAGGIHSASVTIEGNWSEVPPTQNTGAGKGQPSEWTRH